MSWNYRIVQHIDDATDQYVYELCEVYYDSGGLPHGFCKADIYGVGPQDIRDDLEYMGEGASRTYLKYPVDFTGRLLEVDITC